MTQLDKLKLIKMELSIIIPTYNEIDNIKKILPILNLILKRDKINYEIIVVDDNSHDGTWQHVKNVSKKNKKIKLLLRKDKIGITSAILDGFKAAKGDVLIPVMADMSDDPNDIIRLYRKMKEDNYDIVFTTRFGKGGRTYNYPKIKYFFNRFTNYLLMLLFGIKYLDSTNAFKAYNKNVVKNISLDSNGSEALIELTIKAYFNGTKFTEVPISWHNRKIGKTKFNMAKSIGRYLKMLIKIFISKYSNLILDNGGRR